MLADKNYLHNILTEDIYILQEPEANSSTTNKKLSPTEEVIAETKVSDNNQNEATPKLNIKGENKKGILVLVNHQTEAFLEKEDEVLLSKILQSVKLSFEDIALVNAHALDDQLGLLKEISYKKIVSFGVEDLNFAITQSSVKHYDLVPLNDGKLLLADSLKVISSDVEKKKKLWGGLKELFDV
ncbi:hypothetical protein QQ008_00125 [Fulvivirgaceae bacterium BMA10]|uniref:Uncharacterized protein n=1 Tax=Splendidivirga corallicola TaxID=3051826 RepID=A0ABT8KHJ7_9BACT|nr:hypothetical protein [Fulvivirgaceae bacterium BMA10]